MAEERSQLRNAGAGHNMKKQISRERTMPELIKHRQKILGICIAISMLFIAQASMAETYPSRPIRMVVGFSAGSTSDLLTRVVANSLSEKLGQPVIVENRPGASGNIAIENVINSRADGYTLLSAQTTQAIQSGKLHATFDVSKDLQAVAYLGETTFLFYVLPSSPIKSLRDLIDAARKAPGKIKVGSSGIGSGTHLALEYLKQREGLDIVHVPYRGGGEIYTAVMGGILDVGADAPSALLEMIKGGQLRVLAVTAGSRSRALPDVPSASETIPGFDAPLWAGFSAPKNTPKEIVDKLNAAFNSIFTDPVMKEKIFQLGYETKTKTPEEYQNYVGEQVRLWHQVIHDRGIDF
jgi:tripartite-type tricarboxylate transporter receptor subunit TctC